MKKTVNLLFLNILLAFSAFAEEKEIHDPTQPEIKDISTIKIQGIAISDNSLCVIINDKILQKGDKFANYVIKDIKEEKIIFEKKDGKIVEVSV